MNTPPVPSSIPISVQTSIVVPPPPVTTQEPLTTSKVITQEPLSTPPVITQELIETSPVVTTDFDDDLPSPLQSSCASKIQDLPKLLCTSKTLAPNSHITTHTRNFILSPSQHQRKLILPSSHAIFDVQDKIFEHGIFLLIDN